MISSLKGRTARLPSAVPGQRNEFLVVQNKDHDLTAQAEHGDDVVHGRVPEVIEVSREDLEAHPGAEPLSDPGDVKLGTGSDRKR